MGKIKKRVKAEYLDKVCSSPLVQGNFLTQDIKESDIKYLNYVNLEFDEDEYEDEDEGLEDAQNFFGKKKKKNKEDDSESLFEEYEEIITKTVGRRKPKSNVDTNKKESK